MHFKPQVALRLALALLAAATAAQAVTFRGVWRSSDFIPGHRGHLDLFMPDREMVLEIAEGSDEVVATLPKRTFFSG